MEYQRFLFSATNAADVGTRAFKVYQTYADGTVGSWDDCAASTHASKVTIK